MPRDYRWVTKDPIIDLLRTECQRLGNISGHQNNVLGRIAHDAGIGEGTLRNWFFGETRRPQNITTRFVLEAIGIRTQYVRSDGTKVDFDARKVKLRA
jgi:hypothetical protein